jgi:hypothetical protein
MLLSEDPAGCGAGWHDASQVEPMLDLRAGRPAAGRRFLRRVRAEADSAWNRCSAIVSSKRMCNATSTIFMPTLK